MCTSLQRMHVFWKPTISSNPLPCCLDFPSASLISFLKEPNKSEKNCFIHPAGDLRVTEPDGQEQIQYPQRPESADANLGDHRRQGNLDRLSRAVCTPTENLRRGGRLAAR